MTFQKMTPEQRNAVLNMAATLRRSQPPVPAIPDYDEELEARRIEDEQERQAAEEKV